MAVAKVTLNGTTLIDNTEFKERKICKLCRSEGVRR